MRVFETQLPGVGRRYQVRFPDGGALTIVIHNDESREVFWSGDPDADSEELFTATEGDARRIGDIFDGTYFEPISDDVDEVLSEAPIKWVTVPRESPLAGHTIGDIGVRSRTGISILAVKRDGRTIANPTPDTEIQKGDTLVVVGNDDAHSKFEELLISP